MTQSRGYSTSESASVQRECGSKSQRQQVVRELPRRGSTRFDSRRQWNSNRETEERGKKKEGIAALTDRRKNRTSRNATIPKGEAGKRRD